MQDFAYNFLPHVEKCGQYRTRFNTPAFETGEGTRSSFLLGNWTESQDICHHKMKTTIGGCRCRATPSFSDLVLNLNLYHSTEQSAKDDLCSLQLRNTTASELPAATGVSYLQKRCAVTLPNGKVSTLHQISRSYG
jgi:hypothetical protein